MLTGLSIRNEVSADVAAVAELTKAAYADHFYSEEAGPSILEDLRSADALVLSLVAELKGKIVGHLAVSSVTISDGSLNWYGLGPLSVAPEYQGYKVATTLVHHGLATLRGKGAQGCALIGLPAFFARFGFFNHGALRHDGVPREVYVRKLVDGDWPRGEISFHQAYKQLSVVEKDAISEVIVDYNVFGLKMDPTNPVIAGLIEKDIITQNDRGKCLIRVATLAEYDSYLGKVGEHRATELSRAHKNPFLTAVTSR